MKKSLIVGCLIMFCLFFGVNNSFANDTQLSKKEDVKLGMLITRLTNKIDQGTYVDKIMTNDSWIIFRQETVNRARYTTVLVTLILTDENQPNKYIELRIEKYGHGGDYDHTWKIKKNSALWQLCKNLYEKGKNYSLTINKAKALHDMDNIHK